MQKLNVGFIGCGRIADLHYLGYADNPRARLYAICDTDAELLERRRKEWRVEKIYQDYQDLLADPDLDAVEILSPQPLHEPMTLAAAAAGKHIALQKPMTVDLASADRMLSAVTAADVVFRVTDNYVFYPPIRRARRLIEEGVIGRPCNLRIKMISGGAGGWDIPPAAWAWRMAEKAAGRGLQTFDHGHHMWATARYLLGDVERVTAWIDSVDGVIDSPALIMWKYADGVRYGMCEFAHAADLSIPSKYYANDEWIEVTGSRGILLIPRCTGDICTGPGLRIFTDKGWQEIHGLTTDWAEGFRGATANFVAAVSGEEPPTLDGEEARKVLAFALAIGKSARARREVYLDEFDSSWPWWHTQRRIRQERRAAQPPKGLLARLGLGDRDSALAGQAQELTESFVERFDPAAAGDWSAVIGIHLLAEGEASEMHFRLTIADGRAAIDNGPWPEDAPLVLKVPAGTWAAILTGRRRIETAFLQGKLKVEGKAELGLKLRAAFGI